MPCTPIPDSASLTSSSLKGFIIAITNFIDKYPPVHLNNTLTKKHILT